MIKIYVHLKDRDLICIDYQGTAAKLGVTLGEYSDKKILVLGGKKQLYIIPWENIGKIEIPERND